MQSKFLATVATVLLTTIASGQVVTLPKSLTGMPGIPVPIVAECDGKNVTWVTPDKGLVIIDGTFFGGDSKRALVFGPAGSYRVWAFTAKGDIVSPKAECVITIGDVPPDPGPKPDPKPDPKPVGKGSRVLIIEDKEAREDMKPGQRAAIFSETVQSYLNSKCETGKSGKKEWAIWDKDASGSAKGPRWKELMSLPRKELPWIIIDSPKGVVFEGPLPVGVEPTLSLLRKHME